MNAEPPRPDERTLRKSPVGHGSRPSRRLSPVAVIALAYEVPSLDLLLQAPSETDD